MPDVLPGSIGGFYYKVSESQLGPIDHPNVMRGAEYHWRSDEEREQAIKRGHELAEKYGWAENDVEQHVTGYCSVCGIRHTQVVVEGREDD